MPVERISIELTNRCTKGCSFCYNGSSLDGGTRWTLDDVARFVRDCVGGGVKAVSFGGGEPLQFDGLFELLHSLRGVLFRSLTSNGLLLDEHFDALMSAAPDKVHLSIHFPDNHSEVERVIAQTERIRNAGVRSGVNFLVRRSQLDVAISAAQRVRKAGIGNERIVYLPMRIADTPTPAELARVAGDAPFQSMTCLTGCAKSARFCSIGWDRSVAWCSYTKSRRTLPGLTYRELEHALQTLDLAYCGGGSDD